MPFLGKQPTAGFASIVKDDLTADGSTTAFTLSKNVASANDIAVFVGNVRQEPTDAYSVSGTTLTMTAAPSSGVNFYVLHIAGTLESSVIPADDTISTAKIQNDAITGAKIENNPTIAGNLTVSGTTTNTGLITASAGVAIGGTGSANTLGDYEEGSWTPTLDASTTSPSSPTSGNGRYTKIGNIVHAYGFISNISVSGASGNATITGLPFNCNNTISSGNMPGSLYYNNLLLASANHTHAIVEVPNGNSFLYIRIMYSTNNPATVTPANTSYFVEGVTDLRFQITYQTTA
jgi:hypothetical protein